MFFDAFEQKENLIKKGDEMNTGRKNKIRIKTLQDCRRLLARIINELRDGLVEKEQARAQGYLINIIVSILQAEELEKIKGRLAVLEEKSNV